MNFKNLYQEAKKGTGRAALAGLAALTLAGCGGPSKYEFDGRIGEDSLIFSQKARGMQVSINVLYRITPNGRTIIYIDGVNNDLEIEEIEVIEEKTRLTEERMYRYDKSSHIGRAIVDSAQVDFDAYLQKILEAKEEARLDSLQAIVDSIAATEKAHQDSIRAGLERIK